MAESRRQLNSLDHAASVLGIAKSTLRFHIAGKAVQSTKIGGRVFIHDNELDRVQTEGIPTTIADYKGR
jgi:hypothetical protein